VRYRDLAALVSEVDRSAPLGRPQDLRAHAELLDASAAEVPVLPLRFGAVMPSEDAVARELLEEHYDELANALRELEGHVQYVIKGRYVERTILEEILSDAPEAAQLGESIRDVDQDASRQERLALGKIVNDAVNAKRVADTRVLGGTLRGLVAASSVRTPTHELDAVHVAVLIAADAGQDMERAIGELARDWDGRIELRLNGPMAAYDFVGAPGAPPGTGVVLGRMAPVRAASPARYPCEEHETRSTGAQPVEEVEPGAQSAFGTCRPAGCLGAAGHAGLRILQPCGRPRRRRSSRPPLP
jgi:hypothetical protein